MSRVESGISSDLGRKTLRRAGGGEECNRGEHRRCLAGPGHSGASPAAAPPPPPGTGRDPPPAAWGEGGAPALTSGEGFIKAAGAEEIPNPGAEPQRSRQLFPAASCPSPTLRRDAVVPPAVRPGPALHRLGRRHRLGRPLGPAAPAVPAEVPGCRRREAELLSEPSQTENEALESEDLSRGAEQDEVRLELERSANSNPALAPRERKAGCKNFFWKTFTSC
uniref:Somatostatin 1 n=1 Tax=Gallus gallus TaxID=9031 RepID=A0A8V0YEZ4_CHICK